MREIRRRYLAVKIECADGVGGDEFLSGVWGAVVKLYGEYGASRAGLSLVDFDEGGGFGVLRVSHLCVDLVRVALASLTSVGGKRVAVRVLVVSGTIKGVYRRLGMERR